MAAATTMWQPRMAAYAAIGVRWSDKQHEIAHPSLRAREWGDGGRGRHQREIALVPGWGVEVRLEVATGKDAPVVVARRAKTRFAFTRLPVNGPGLEGHSVSFGPSWWH